MYYALMYETHEFFDKNIDDRFFAELEREREHTYETDDDEEGGEEGSEENGEEDGEEDSEGTEDEIQEEYTIDCVLEEEKLFHANVMKYANEWRDWFPEDPIKSMLKRAIDNTRVQVPMEV